MYVRDQIFTDFAPTWSKERIVWEFLFGVDTYVIMCTGFSRAKKYWDERKGWKRKKLFEGILRKIMLETNKQQPIFSEMIVSLLQPDSSAMGTIFFFIPLVVFHVFRCPMHNTKGGHLVGTHCGGLRWTLQVVCSFKCFCHMSENQNGAFWYDLLTSSPASRWIVWCREGCWLIL